MGVDDSLGLAGGAGREENFRHRVGTDRGIGGVDLGARLGREDVSEFGDAAAARRVGAGDDLERREVERSQRRAVAGATRSAM
jgi:hypothetical protein